MPHSAEHKPPETPITRFIDDTCTAYATAMNDADTLDRHGHHTQATTIRQALKPLTLAVMRLARATRHSDDEPTTTKGASTNG